MLSKIKAIPEFLVQIFHSLPLKTWLIAGAFSLFLWLWVFGHHGLYESEQLLRLKRRLLQQQTELIKEKEELEAEIKRLDDPRYLKHLIHKEMGFVEPGEVIIKFPQKK